MQEGSNQKNEDAKSGSTADGQSPATVQSAPGTGSEKESSEGTQERREESTQGERTAGTRGSGSCRRGCSTFWKVILVLFLLPVAIVLTIVAVVVYIVLFPLKCLCPCLLPCLTALTEFLWVLSSIPRKVVAWACNSGEPETIETLELSKSKVEEYGSTD
ncbi:uncharacterized protein LOC141904217 [Tubulanus polymorphus]|uniref:uncharacterized protein LOC141904217 n=1 Tax=Tubulanus polymorphus TaxID=672921 RepID=UPI003DA48991